MNKAKPSPPSQTALRVLIPGKPAGAAKFNPYRISVSTTPPFVELNPHFSKMATPSCPSPTRRQDKDRFSQPNPQHLMAHQEWLSASKPPEGSPQTALAKAPPEGKATASVITNLGRKVPRPHRHPSRHLRPVADQTACDQQGY